VQKDKLGKIEKSF